jgi:very-short-patch-repair endonuclease
MDRPKKEHLLSLRNRERGANKLCERASSLRKNSTEAERLLWQSLRGRRMEGYKFRRQVIIEPYIVDFFCIEAKLIIEADGGQHADQSEYDAKRSAQFEAIGYRVMRFWNHEILHETSAVLEQIRRVLLISPHPVPLPEGEGTI